VLETVLVALASVAGIAASIVLLRLHLPSANPLVTQGWIAYMFLLSTLAAFVLLLRSPGRERWLWTIGGLVFGFTILGGFSIGPAYLPAAGLLFLGALVGDVRSPRSLLAHVPLACLACVLQIAAPLLILHQLYR
jgi:hypothetical protein